MFKASIYSPSQSVKTETAKLTQNTLVFATEERRLNIVAQKLFHFNTDKF
jgi:hypothetical protein